MAAALDVAVEQGPLRVAVNCAGTGDAIRILGKKGVYPLEKFARIVQINLIGTFNVIRLAAERMVANEPIGDPARSAASSSTRPRSPPSTARSARPRTPPPRAASSA